MAGLLKQFLGKSGKLYVLNPFHDRAKPDACYAVYPVADQYGKIIPTYTNSEEALADFGEITQEEKYVFSVLVNGAQAYKFETSLVGKLQEPIEGIENGRDYLKHLKIKHEGQAFKYTFEKV